MRNLNSEGSQICMRSPLQINFLRDYLFSSKHTTHCSTLESKCIISPKSQSLSSWLILFCSFLLLFVCYCYEKIFKSIFSKFPFSREAWLLGAVHLSPCVFACASSSRCGASALPAALAQDQNHFSEFSQQFSACATIPDLHQKNNPPPRVFCSLDSHLLCMFAL